MLADHLAAQVFHADLEAAATGRAFLNEVRGSRHDFGTSITLPDPEESHHDTQIVKMIQSERLIGRGRN